MRSQSAEPPTWEAVRKRNSIERMKAVKPGLDVIHELPAMIATGYEAVPEEDFVRLQWYGAYHDKPKVGTFMLRVKIPAGILVPRQLELIGRLSRDLGHNHGELTTRQNVQLHGLRLEHLPEVLATLDGVGLPSAGACGDNVRNFTSCPLVGIDAAELFDVRPTIERAARFFREHREYSDLPRKHKITIAACPHQCNAPQIHCIALIGVVREGQNGFAIRVGGGLSTFPRIADDLGVWIPEEDAVEVLAGILDVWRTDLRYRMSRARARLKFMIEDLGAEAFRALLESRLGRTLLRGEAPRAPEREIDHTGVHAQKQDGLTVLGFPVPLGLISGSQMVELSLVAAAVNAEIRITRRQNFLLANVPHGDVASVVAQVERIGFSPRTHPLRALSIACTGDPFCNFTVASTKSRLAMIVEHLEQTFGDQVAGLKLHLDGCPHACAHHWIGDIGLQGTTLRERGPNGERRQGYDVFLRGALGANAAIGRPVLRRVPADDIHTVLERLVRGWLDERAAHSANGAPPTLLDFFDRSTDEQLLALAGLALEGTETPQTQEV